MNNYVSQHGEDGSLVVQSCGEDSNSGFSLDEYKQTLSAAKDVRHCTYNEQ